MRFIGSVNYLWFREEYLVEALSNLNADRGVYALQSKLEEIGYLTSDVFELQNFLLAGEKFYKIASEILSFASDRKITNATENTTDTAFLQGLQYSLVQDYYLNEYFKISNFQVGESFNLDTIANSFNILSSTNLQDIKYQEWMTLYVKIIFLKKWV